ncbi:hypothetical protein BV25DRAFT_1827522 [Artomyces pyxidatus]|uniref:Uncharacterized protein n=1 Tax=Artomyces pyxidatus TaxID=48021 RepID=A0ACB8SWU1_9AGAM|nr:hypothetical protein BV25DRAFT_1827522 [Artomyces pyxidatus]
MGSASSNISSESVLTVVVLAGALTFGYFQYTRTADSPQPSAAPSKKKQKKGKQVTEPVPSKADPTPAPVVTPFPTVIPGEFESGSTADVDPAAKSKKPKKKKGKKAASEQQAALSDSSTGAAPKAAPKAKKQSPPAQGASAPSDVRDERWTRVESRKKKPTPVPVDAGAVEGEKAVLKPTLSTADLGTSDAGITTSVTTGNSSPVTERTTEDELPVSGNDELSALEASTSEPPPPRVLRIKPQPGEKPAKGFTWEDYEGVQVDNDADGEDDAGWGVVKSKSRARAERQGAGGTQSTSASQSSQPLTKKQRQNAAKREAQKLAKQEADKEQQAALAAHKRELERVRMAEQFASPKGKGTRV